MLYLFMTLQLLKLVDLAEIIRCTEGIEI